MTCRMYSLGFQNGLHELERIAAIEVVGFMCAEGLPDRCHRRFVAGALALRGHAVAHRYPDGSLVSVQPRLELPDR